MTEENKEEKLETGETEIKEVSCFYCDGVGEVPESSTSYMNCPACDGKRVLPMNQKI